MPTKTTATKAAPRKTTTTSRTPAATDTGDHEYVDALAISALVKHPKNPRQRATADAELIDSVKASGIVQPLIVAPHDDAGKKFILIAGHRRLDASRKAGRKTVPVVIRRDLPTEGQQIEAMLVENGRRVDLTPVEEAEGYAQLELIGYKAPAIAKAVGRDVKTVKSRLQLLRLSTSTRKRVHAGQLNLNDASAMVEFADDPATTQRLEKAAGDGYYFKQELAAARRRRDSAREVATRTAKLLDAGAQQLEVPDDASVYSWIREGGRSELGSTHSTDWGQHKGCLAFVTSDDAYYGPRLYEVCTNPDSHREDLEAEARQRAEAAEAQIKAAQERSLAQAAAADARVATLMDLVEGITVADVLGDLTRALLPIALRQLAGDALVAYQQAMRVPMEDRWNHLGYHHGSPMAETKFAQHVEELVADGNSRAARSLAALLIAQGEHANDYTHILSYRSCALEYFALLEEAGHAMSPVDTAQREEHQRALDEAKAKTKAAS